MTSRMRLRSVRQVELTYSNVSSLLIDERSSLPVSQPLYFGHENAVVACFVHCCNLARHSGKRVPHERKTIGEFKRITDPDLPIREEVAHLFLPLPKYRDSETPARVKQLVCVCSSSDRNGYQGRRQRNRHEGADRYAVRLIAIHHGYYRHTTCKAAEGVTEFLRFDHRFLSPSN